VSVDPKKLGPIEEILRDLKGHFDGIPNETVTWESLSEAYSGLTVRDRVTQELEFKPPERLELVGSFLLRTLCQPHLNVDVAVQMPSECFHPRDFLNYRYFDRRAMYLSVLAKSLEGHESVKSVSLEGFNGDRTKPVLLITPAIKGKNKLCSKFTIRILPYVDASIFPAAKLLPNRNNVRPLDESAEEAAPCTPQHNNAIVEDMRLVENLRFLHGHLSTNPRLAECAILFKVWLRQRGLSTVSGGLNGFVLTMLLVHLIQSRKANREMSAYQLLRVALEFLRTADFSGKGVAMMAEERPDMAAFSSTFPAVFLDPSGRLNLMSRLTAAMAWDLRHEAGLTLGYLNDRATDAFNLVFMSNISPTAKFDEVLSVEMPPLDVSLGIEELEDRRAQRLQLEDLLCQGLGDRVHLVRTVDDNAGTRWELDEEVPEEAHVTVGLLLDSENHSRLVDKGPSADDKAASTSFRQFWGEKSELRRFKDGAIVEAVVWEESKGAGHLIPHHVIRHVLERHMAIEKDSVQFSGASVHEVLATKGKKKSAQISNAASLRAVAAFEEVAKELKNLPNMPLEVTEITPVSSAFRYTDVFPPLPHQLAKGAEQAKNSDQHSRVVPVLEGIISFETSSKWSEDIGAVQHLKAGFYAHMAAALQKSKKYACKVSENWLRVICDGFVYQFKIAYAREVALYPKGAPEALAVEIEYVMRPLHHRILHGLQMKHPMFGPTVRLAQRWMHCHLFSRKYQEEMIELIVAYIFSSPGPYETPVSATAGFIRFLKLVATFDWASNALVVDPNSDLKTAEINDIQKNVEAMVEAGTKPTVFIATGQDKDKSVWTVGITKQLWGRVVAYAKKGVLMLNQPPPGQPSVFSASQTTRVLFQNDLTDFDVAIHLNRSNIPNWSQALHGSSKAPPRGKLSLSQYKNLQIDMDGLLVGFDPVGNYVKALEENFGDLAMFFYDQLGGDVVAIVWKPTAFLPGDFRVTEAHNRLPLEMQGKKHVQTIPNILSILKDIEALGEGLVERVEQVDA